MADFDRARGELHVKVLYVGPPRSGKTTCLQVLGREAAKHGRAVDARERPGGLMEHVQLSLGKVFGRFTAHVHVVAAPSGAALDPTHRHMVRSCDGVVFVADANPARAEENARARGMLEADLRREGRDPAALPFVVQWNKRDLGGAGSEALRDDLAAGRPAIDSVATRGEGVTAAFQRACLAALRNAGDAHGLATRRMPRPDLPDAAEATPAGGVSVASARGGAHVLTRLFDRARAMFR